VSCIRAGGAVRNDKKGRNGDASESGKFRKQRKEGSQGKRILTKTRIREHHHVLLDRVVDGLRISVSLDVMLVESFLLLLLSESGSGVGCWSGRDLGCWRWRWLLRLFGG